MKTLRRPSTWDELVDFEPRLQGALGMASVLAEGAHAYECFKHICVNARIVGWGARIEGVATPQAWDIAMQHAWDVLTLVEVGT